MQQSVLKLVLTASCDKRVIPQHPLSASRLLEERPRMGAVGTRREAKPEAKHKP